MKLYRFVLAVEAGFLEFDVKVDFGMFGSADEACITGLQQRHELGLSGVDAHGHSPDLNDEAETFDFGSQLGQGNIRPKLERRTRGSPR